MVDIDKHISYWLKGAQEDLEVAHQLIALDKVRHGLFFLHLAVEKILKAHICRNKNDIAPRLHNLVRLAELSGIHFEQYQSDLLSEMNPFNLEGRYPEIWGPVLTQKDADAIYQRTKELFEWLKNQF